MPSRRNNRRKGPRRKRGSRDPEYVPRGITGLQDRSVIKTFGLTATLTQAAPTGTANWTAFEEFSIFAELYQYFVPQSYRITVTNTTFVAPGGFLVVGLIPNNWPIESALTFAGDAADLLALRGAVRYQLGASNRGGWVKWPKANFQLGTQLSLAKTAITLASAGAAATSTYTILVQVNVALYRHECEFAAGVPPPLVIEKTSRLTRFHSCLLASDLRDTQLGPIPSPISELEEEKTPLGCDSVSPMGKEVLILPSEDLVFKKRNLPGIVTDPGRLRAKLLNLALVEKTLTNPNGTDYTG